MHYSAAGRRAAGLWVLALTAVSGSPAIGGQAALGPAAPVELRSNERDLYPGRFDVAIRSIERLPSAVGVRAELVSDMKDFSHFVYATDGGPFREAANGVLVISFEDRHTPDFQSARTVIRAVSRSERFSRDFALRVNFYPCELYAKAGQTAPGYVIVKETDIPLLSSRVEDWTVGPPSADEIGFARATWGKRLSETSSPLERARMLARTILDDLAPHRGTPSDAMNAAPFEQYRRAAAGLDRVWCSNLAEIFVRACSCFGIPARAIKMMRPASSGPGYDFLMAEGHETTEVFDEAANRWVWIDLTFGMTGLEIPGHGPLNMAELHRFLNDPAWAGSLLAVVYDPGARKESRVALAESGRLESLMNFFKRDQTFTYFRRPTK